MSKVIDFLNNKWYADNLDRGNITNILDFALLWNLFELKFFEKKFYPKKIDLFIRNCENNIDENIINITYLYFKNRYFENWNFKDKFKELFNDRELKYEHFVFNSFGSNEIENKIKTIILIIYRLRNNLFHWEKEIKFIEEQEENFKISNDFLMSLLKNL